MSEKKELPLGWWEAIDPKSGKPYYYKSDGTRQWHFPQNNDDDEDENEDRKTTQKTTLKEVQIMGFDNSLFSLILRFLLFPFTSIFHGGIWMVVQFVFIVLELISGFVSLWMGGVGYLKILEQVGLSEEGMVIGGDVTINTSFLVVFLLGDALVWLGESIVHYVLMVTGAAQYLLEHPPAFNTSPFEFIPKSSGKNIPRILFFIRLVLFFIVRVFQLVWTLIAFCKLAVEFLSPTTSYIDTQLSSRAYPQTKDLQQYNSTATLVRGLTACFVTLNLVSLALWTFLIVFCLIMRHRSNNGAAHIEDSSSSSHPDNNSDNNNLDSGGGKGSQGEEEEQQLLE